jgi:betaine-aldehyde dehydrogenase
VNAGKPLQEAAWDVDDVAGCFRYNAGLAEALDAKQGSAVDVGMDEFDVKLYYEPVGVCALITPWNYPLLMATWKVAAALAAGNAIVLKPSELAPFTCVDLAVLAHAAGVPAGAFSVVTGLGPDAGAPLAAHSGVDKVAFTGSVATGARIMQACAPAIRNVSLELGGKSPIIVFPDTPVDIAVHPQPLRSPLPAAPRPRRPYRPPRPPNPCGARRGRGGPRRGCSGEAG